MGLRTTITKIAKKTVFLIDKFKIEVYNINIFKKNKIKEVTLMKTRWLHAIGGLIAFSSIVIGISRGEFFVTFSITVPIMAWWSIKDSLDKETLRGIELVEMNALQRGIEKGLRRSEIIIIALLIPTFLMIKAGHLMSGVFLGMITLGMMFSAIAGELELEMMERIEKEMMGMDPKQKYPLRELIKDFFSILKGEFSALWHKKRRLVPFLIRMVWVIDAFINTVVFRKSRSALLDYIGL